MYRFFPPVSADAILSDVAELLYSSQGCGLNFTYTELVELPWSEFVWFGQWLRERREAENEAMRGTRAGTGRLCYAARHTVSLNSMGLGLSLFAEDRASGPIQQVGKALGGLEKRVAGATVSMEQVGAEMKRAGTRMVIAGLAGVSGLGAAAFAADEFSSKIAEVATEADLAIFPQERMKSLAKELSERYGKMPVEQAEAMYNAVAFGANDAAKASDLMSAANELAIAGVTDVKSAVDALAGTARAYNADFSKSSDISDTFFKAMTMGKMKVSDLAAAMPKATGIAASLGIGYDQLAGSIALLTSRGVDASEAVTGIKAALTNVIKPSSEATAEAARLGIKFDQATLRAKGWPAFLRDIVTNGKYSAETMTKLFSSVEGGNAILQMVGSGMGDMDAMMAAMADRSGATRRGFELMSKEGAFAFSQLKAQIAVAVISIGEAVKPVLGLLISFAQRIVSGFNALPGPLKNGLVLATALVSVFLVLAGGALALAGSIAALAAGGEVMLVAFAASVGILQYAAAALAIIGGAAYVAKRAVEENLGGIGTFVAEQAGRVRLAWEGLTQLFSAGEFSGAVMDEMARAGNGGVRDFVIQVFMWGSRVQAFLSGIVDGFNSGFGQLGEAFGALRVALQQVASLFSLAKDGPTEAGAAYASWASAGVTAGQLVASAIGKVVSALAWVISVGANFADVFTQVVTPLGMLVTVGGRVLSALAPLATVFESIGTGSTSGAGGVTMFARALALSVGGLAYVAQAMSGPLTAAIGVVVAGVSGMVSIWSGIAGAFSGVVNVVVGLLTGNFAQAFLGVKQIVFGVVQAVVGYFGMLVSAVAGIVDGIGRIVGKDFGLQKSFETFKSGSLRALSLTMGLEKGPTAQTALPSATNPPPGAGATPGATSSAAGAQTVPGAPPPVIPAGAGTTSGPALPAPGQDVGAAVAAAMKAAPPAQVNVNHTTTLQVDGQVLAEVVERHQTAGANRSGK